VDPVPDPLLRTTGNLNRTSGPLARNSDNYTTGGRKEVITDIKIDGKY
jgi:hypothetical protein